jgi:hypothetical protein
MWIDLVEKWAEYERAKCWKSAKVRFFFVSSASTDSFFLRIQGLPAKGRPEEWQKWTSKARWGVRDYSRIPDVEDAADLGLAVMNWVSSFNSADFGKAGFHGMVTLLTLMAWWGTAALTPSSWNSDSRPQWQTLVQDLCNRFNVLLNEHSVFKRSLENNNADEGPENKR